MDVENKGENFEIEDEFTFNGYKDLFGLTDVYTSFSYVMIIFLIFAIGGGVQVSLVLYGVVDSNEIKDDVITPIISISNEFTPDAALPCYYPPYTQQYNETKPCLGSNSTEQYYCAEVDFCVTDDDGNLYCEDPFFMACTADVDYCLDFMSSLPIINDTVTTQSIEEATSIWSAVIPICFLLLCCVSTVIFIFFIRSSKSDKKKHILTFCIWGNTYLLVIGVIIGIVIFLTTTPFFIHDNSGCFESSMHLKLSTISNLVPILLVSGVIYTLLLILITPFVMYHFIKIYPIITKPTDDLQN